MIKYHSLTSSFVKVPRHAVVLVLVKEGRKELERSDFTEMLPIDPLR